MNILAMDLAKDKTVVCDYDSKSGKHSYSKVRTMPQQIHDMLVEKSPDRVVFEICSAAGWIYDIVKAFKIEVQVANPNTQACSQACATFGDEPVAYGAYTQTRGSAEAKLDSVSPAAGQESHTDKEQHPFDTGEAGLFNG
jgi:hypothetical protein